ncbi:MAG: ABC transporter ATP-binding protein [Dehalococcoidia bacterium]|nr:ABC transporter ATP-binding protein [Dehalococcoidia bacterium]
MSNMIEGRGLIKRFDGLTAVAGIDFHVGNGELLGFLGPNGAGKTTTLKMIYCAVPLTEGDLQVDGMQVGGECRRIKAILGVAPQEENLDPDLTVEENLRVYARYFDLPKQVARQRVLDLLRFFQLEEKAKSHIESLSGGMKRKLIIARALVNQPRILILDEPTVGLDPQSRHSVWQRLTRLRSQGITMIISTHNMEEAAYLCDRVIVMHLGRILAEGKPADLVNQHTEGTVTEVRLDAQPGAPLLKELARRQIAAVHVEDVLYLFTQVEPDVLQGMGIPSASLVQRPANLEDVFLRLTGTELA